MKNGEAVALFEREFARAADARYAIALCNGTATLHTALAAMGVSLGDRVAVPPLTMSSPTIAVLMCGARPVFVDVDSDSWVMTADRQSFWFPGSNLQVYDHRCPPQPKLVLPVALYGLPSGWVGDRVLLDAAETFSRPQESDEQKLQPAFTSYSFQASKILATGEGGMLVTNDEQLATRAREFSSLGYRMRPDQPRIDPAVLKSPDYARHHSLGYNYRMADAVAILGLQQLARADELLALRQQCAGMYRTAIAGCDWITPQFVPEGWRHDYWTFAVALKHRDIWGRFVDSIVRHGGERPYACWRLTYQEPAFRHLAPDGTCPVAEDLQPRLVQFQTNKIEDAERNAAAVVKAIAEIGGR